MFGRTSTARCTRQETWRQARRTMIGILPVPYAETGTAPVFFSNMKYVCACNDLDLVFVL